MLLRALTEGVRSSLANIRAAIETISQYPEMDANKLDQLRNIIYEESITLSGKLNDATKEYALDMKTAWQLEDMLDTDLLWAIQRRIEEKLKVMVAVKNPVDSLWIKVDSYSVVQATTFIVRQLKTEFNVNQVELCLKQTGQLAALDLIWHNGTVDMNVMWSWQNERMNVYGDDSSLTLREVAELHGGEVWCQADKATNTAYFRLLLPISRAKSVRTVPVVQASRPEYYDFDLFHQPGQNPELDQRLLTDLTHTVFDTETTGLNPAGGDEIISVSAIRIVNGRLLRQEIFDQLVDPRRHLPKASTEITGISSEMLMGQPTVEQVLPVFYKFAEGTVLVAHNAAFDMRMLQLKETKTGVKFTNPVLDTLLLSAVVHPNEEDHDLEAIASRLGINVIGRHTSLGDAIVTGEVFLRLIPVLAEKGIHTLADARNAAQETYLARLKY
jgi:DNA polymerase-3 subunit epsilon